MTLDLKAGSDDYLKGPSRLAMGIMARLDIITARMDAIALRVEAIAPCVETVATEVRELHETTQALAEIVKASLVNDLIAEVQIEMKATERREEATDKSSPQPTTLTDEQKKRANQRLIYLWTNAKGDRDDERAQNSLVPDAIRNALYAGADVNAKDKYGWTALMSAAYNGLAESVEVLLDSGADKNLKNFGGWHALWHAQSPRQHVTPKSRAAIIAALQNASAPRHQAKL